MVAHLRWAFAVVALVYRARAGAVTKDTCLIEAVVTKPEDTESLMLSAAAVQDRLATRTDTYAPERSYILAGRQIWASNLLNDNAFDTFSESEHINSRLQELFELTDKLAEYTFDQGPTESELVPMLRGTNNYRETLDIQNMPINVAGTKTWCAVVKDLKGLGEAIGQAFARFDAPREEGLGDGKVVRLGTYTAPDGKVASVFQKVYRTLNKGSIAMDFLALEHLLEKETVGFLKVKKDIHKFFKNATETLRELKLFDHLLCLVKWIGGGHLIKLHVTEPEVGNGDGVQASDSFRLTGIDRVVTFETLPRKGVFSFKIMNWKQSSEDSGATSMVAPFNPHSEKHCISSKEPAYLPTINRDYNLVHLRIQGEGTLVTYTPAAEVAPHHDTPANEEPAAAKPAEEINNNSK